MLLLEMLMLMRETPETHEQRKARAYTRCAPRINKVSIQEIVFVKKKTVRESLGGGGEAKITKKSFSLKKKCSNFFTIVMGVLGPAWACCFDTKKV